MPHSFSYAVSMNLEHSIKEGSHERYPDHFQCFRNKKKIKYPDFQAMTVNFLNKWYIFNLLEFSQIWDVLEYMQSISTNVTSMALYS